jgi:hypothetical protein
MIKNQREKIKKINLINDLYHIFLIKNNNVVNLFITIFIIYSI